MRERRLTDAELEASRWIARLEASDVTLEDHQRFRQWLAESEENRIAHEALSRTWDRLDALKLLSPKPSLDHRRTAPSRRALLLGVGSAAAVAGSASIAFWTLTPAITFAATYETPIGGREEAALQDGSQIALNADTRIRAAFTERARIVHLDRGEALFTVSPDRRPFEVRTPFGSIVTEATMFLVKLGPDFARASVLAGQVRGQSDAKRISERQVAAADQELVLSSHAINLNDLAPDGVANRLAWRNHMLAFDGETLAEAASDVGRQTGARFVFADADIATLRIGGYINAHDLEAFIALLESNLALNCSRDPDGAIVIRR